MGSDQKSASRLDDFSDYCTNRWHCIVQILLAVELYSAERSIDE
jgi:hypothetical protein